MGQLDNVAVLLTCFNRRETTLKCLRSLDDQTLPESIGLKTYMVDDGCSDGTSDAVRQRFPDVNIIQGDGNLYWCGGMRLAWKKAMENEYDFYLWLNDDVVLQENALHTLLSVWHSIYDSVATNLVVVGACKDLRNGTLVYGGHDRKGYTLPESDVPQPCSSMNGNIVLVPKEIFFKVGNLSEDYVHAQADIDYGYRVRNNGYHIYVTQGILGTCECERIPKWVRSSVPLKLRWNLFHSPRGLPPREYAKLGRQSGLLFWYLRPIKLYLRVLFPRIWEWRDGMRRFFQKQRP